MDLPAIIRRLDAFPDMLRAVCAPLTPSEARHKPVSERWPKGAWSVLEIVCHLVDEEREDFRARLRMVLVDPHTAWPKIDPEGWPTSRGYLEQNLGKMLDAFARERADSVAWLRSLEVIDWSRTHEHPSVGPIRAGDLIAAWAAHDALHLRQIAKRLYELAAVDAPTFRTDYAGEWSA